MTDIRMIHELPYRRLLVMTEGHLGTFTSKTGTAVMRYRPDDIVAVLDSTQAGASLPAILEGAPDVPVVPDVARALAYKPDAILVGIAPVGGALPAVMRNHVMTALQHGLAVISGMHTLLGQDAELAALAERHRTTIHDVRDPGPVSHIASGQARHTRARRILTVGTDCSVGKMVTALELCRAAKADGRDAAFVATGQTGIMIEGWGIAVDHVLSDFAAGAAELLIRHVADRDICFMEGQGSIAHPGYSGVTLSLLHGCCPDAMILCHRPDRTLHNDWQDCPLAPLEQQRRLYEQILAPLHPGRVVGIALNTAGMPADQAEAAIQSAAEATGLPAADPIRTGCDALWRAIRDHLDW